MQQNEATTILFSKEFVKELELMHRIPPTSIGVRRSRPSSKAVLSEMRRQKREKKKKNIRDNGSYYDCTDDNDSRQLLKRKHEESAHEESAHEKSANQEASAEESHKDAKKQNDVIIIEGEKTSMTTSSNTCSTKTIHHNTSTSTSSTREHEVPQRSIHSYYQFELNPQAIQEEIAELKNEDRRAYNNLPVLLSPPMTYACLPLIDKHLDDEANTRQQDLDIIIDDDLASRWSKVLHKEIEIEEIERNKEDLRPLAYKLKPEVWTRLRPSLTSNNHEDNNEKSADVNDQQQEIVENDPDEEGKASYRSSTTEEILKLTCKNMRPYFSENEFNWYDTTHRIVYSCLYNQFPNFHISCGAKFGCDYLIYDGCRMERHAFAGLRILKAPAQSLHDIMPKEGDESSSFPLPKPCNLAGYVRCLNTAGKLALLALVAKIDAKDDGTNGSNCKYHVAIIDLALEKVATAQAHVRKRVKKNQLRKDVGLNLAKKNAKTLI